MNQYIVWVEFTDERKSRPGHWVYNSKEAAKARAQFDTYAGQAGVDYAILTYNGNAIDTWGT